MAQRRSVVALHATTSHDWMATLHRHVAGIDDCIRCRTRDMRTPEFACSTAQVEDVATGEKRDASLPFLSAASGLMLATALQKLQRGELSTGDINEWRWDFGSAFKMARSGRRECLAGCDIRSTPIDVLRRINENSRWKSLLD
jgi:hypothetical protein